MHARHSLGWPLTCLICLFLTSGCDLDYLQTELNEATEDVKRMTGQVDREIEPIVEEKEKFIPPVPPQHLALLDQLMEQLPELSERKRFVGVGPKVGRLDRFYKWRYNDLGHQTYVAATMVPILDEEGDGNIDDSTEFLEKVRVTFNVNTNRSKQEYLEEFEAEQADVDPTISIQLAFLLDLRFNEDHWEFSTGRFCRAGNRGQTTKIQPGTSHYDYCQYLLTTNQPVLSGAEDDSESESDFEDESDSDASFDDE